MSNKPQDINKTNEDNKSSIVDKILNVLLVVLVILIVTIFTAKLFFIGVYKVNGESMYPTFEDGQRIIAPLVKDKTVLEHDDVLMLDLNIKMIKRLVALPGDTIKIEEGKVYVNGELREKDPYTHVNLYDLSDNSTYEYTLKDDEYFVLGDNRGNSEDSRSYGPVSKEDILAVYEREIKTTK